MEVDRSNQTPLAFFLAYDSRALLKKTLLSSLNVEGNERLLRSLQTPASTTPRPSLWSRFSLRLEQEDRVMQAAGIRYENRALTTRP
jgi:hypothetical protein